MFAFQRDHIVPYLPPWPAKRRSVGRRADHHCAGARFPRWKANGCTRTDPPTITLESRSPAPRPPRSRELPSGRRRRRARPPTSRDEHGPRSARDRCLAKATLRGRFGDRRPRCCVGRPRQRRPVVATAGPGRRGDGITGGVINHRCCGVAGRSEPTGPNPQTH